MSEFSNPYGRTPEQSATYIAAVVGMLGGREPLAVLAELLPALEELTAGLPDEALRRPERPGKWSIAAVVAHLADQELVVGYRIRVVLAQPGAVLEGYDQDAWAAELGYAEASFSGAVEQLSALRRANLRLLGATTGERLDHFGLHSERGPESLRQLTRLAAGHDLIHRRQIARIRAAIEGAPG